MNFDCIMGIDNVRKFNIKLNFEDNTVIIGNNIIPMKGISEVGINQFNVKSETDLNSDDNHINLQNDDSKEIIFDERYIKEYLNRFHIQEQGFLDKLVPIILNNKILFDEQVMFAKNYEHIIEVNDNSPLKCRTYPIPQTYQSQVEKEITILLEQGIIERSTSYYINPITIVRKSDGSLRICLDAREINKRILPSFENPLNIDILITKCGNGKIFSKLDLKAAFWLIRLSEDSKQYCAFSINGNVYQFTVSPFGIKTSPSALIKFLHQILNKYDNFCIHYFDDILIFSNSLEEHLVHLNIIFNTLKENGMKLNLQKCLIAQKEVEYLGHILSGQGIKIDETRIKEIREFPRPRKLKSLRSFLGLLSYYRQFIPAYSTKTLPLLELLKKGVKWNWSQKHEEAFQTLKQAFAETLLLYHPDFNRPFILRCDAAKYVIAAELVQFQEELEIPIKFISRTLKPSEIKYSISEKEMLALVYSITKFRYYLLGRRFTIETDHIALLTMMDHKFNNSRMYRWSLLIAEYDFEIIHKPGRLMIAADVLSRKHEGKQLPEVMIANLILQKQGIFSKRKIQEVQGTPELQAVKERLKTEEYKGMYLEKGFIRKQIGNRQVYVVNSTFTLEIIELIHTHYNHIGSRKCWLMFREIFFCNNDERLCKNFIRNCNICQLSKNKNFHNENIPKNILVQEKLELITIDYLVNLPRSSKGYKNIFVIYDLFSKYVKLFPTEKCNTDTTLDALEQYFTEFGIPQKILADNATYFNNDRYKNHLKKLNIKPYFITIRNPRANACERIIGEILKYLRIMLAENHYNWTSKLPKIEHTINHTPNTELNSIPYVIMTGNLPDRPWKSEEEIHINEEYMRLQKLYKLKNDKWERKQLAKIKKCKTYKLNDLVIVKSLKVTDPIHHKVAKLTKPYTGPYIITKVLNENTYEISDPETHTIKGRYHVNSLYDYNITN